MSLDDAPPFVELEVVDRRVELRAHVATGAVAREQSAGAQVPDSAVLRANFHIDAVILLVMIDERMQTEPPRSGGALTGAPLVATQSQVAWDSTTPATSRARGRAI